MILTLVLGLVGGVLSKSDGVIDSQVLSRDNITQAVAPRAQSLEF
jgi:hypothetical protein